MYKRIATALGLCLASATIASAQPQSFTSAEGRSMSFELIVTNRSSAVITLAESHAYSGQATGKRQHKPIQLRRQVPAGATDIRILFDWNVSETEARASTLPMEEISFVYHKITWAIGGVQHTCNAKFPASYRGADKKIVVQVGDLATLQAPDGRPIPSKCQER